MYTPCFAGSTLLQPPCNDGVYSSLGSLVSFTALHLASILCVSSPLRLLLSSPRIDVNARNAVRFVQFPEVDFTYACHATCRFISYAVWSHSIAMRSAGWERGV